MIASSNKPIGSDRKPHFVYGSTPAMLALRRKVELVAGSDVPILITGETGTGKEALAQQIHSLSPRSTNPFVKVNCAAIPSALMESELFGFERGAFTGAVVRRTGKFELASGGAIFLDEIADLDLSLQPKLLQVLQDGTVFAVGGSEEKPLDVRVICATNHDLETEVREARFRRDLFYLINVLHIQLPPLRHRLADIGLFVDYFLGVYVAAYQKAVPPLSSAALQLLTAYDWPGNVRELENLIRQYVVLENEAELRRTLQFNLEQGMARLAAPDGTIALKKHVKAVAQRSEKELILKVLRYNQWNRKKTARMLKISYRALLYKLKECGIERGMKFTYGD
jgi:two-component system response regulator AtoC